MYILNSVLGFVFISISRISCSSFANLFLIKGTLSTADHLSSSNLPSTKHVLRGRGNLYHPKYPSTTREKKEFYVYSHRFQPSQRFGLANSTRHHAIILLFWCTICDICSLYMSLLAFNRSLLPGWRFSFCLGAVLADRCAGFEQLHLFDQAFWSMGSGKGSACRGEDDTQRFISN